MLKTVFLWSWCLKDRFNENKTVHTLFFLKNFFKQYWDIFLNAVLGKYYLITLSYLILLLAILIPACASSSPAFLMMYSAYKLNKQGDNIQPWHTPFPIWNQSVVPCPVLAVASWPAYRFLKRQRNQRSNCQHPLDHRKSKRVSEKYLLLLYWLSQSLWLCGSQ